MLIRLAIILSLLLQPLLIPAAFSAQTGSTSVVCCCEPATTTHGGCCAPRPSCGCEALPMTPPPGEREPAVLTAKELGPLSLPLRALAIGFAHAERPRTAAQAAELEVSQEHSRVQALLGVWLT